MIIQESRTLHHTSDKNQVAQEMARAFINKVLKTVLMKEENDTRGANKLSLTALLLEKNDWDRFKTELYDLTPTINEEVIFEMIEKYESTDSSVKGEPWPHA